jgi:hypothetical protein
MDEKHFKRIEVLGSQMAYVDTGEGPVVLFQHRIALDGRMLRPGISGCIAAGPTITGFVLLSASSVASLRFKSVRTRAFEAGYGFVSPSAFASWVSSILAGRSLSRVQFLNRCGMTA